MQTAYEHASMILSWQENLPAGEMPPSYLWHSDSGLTDWFEQTEIEKESKAATADPSNSWEEVEMDENEEAAGYKRAMGIR